MAPVLSSQPVPAFSAWPRGILLQPSVFRSFPGGSAGKESACNAGDPGSIPGWGTFAGAGVGCPLQASLASPVAQLVKNQGKIP